MGSTIEEKNHHHHLQLPTIDFSKLDQKNPKSQQWQTSATKVAQALETHGCFEAIYDKISTQLRDELFGQAIKELFDLPIDVKMRNSSTEGKFMGYIGQLPGMAYESLRIDAAATIDGVESFTNLLWPEGNPKFWTTAWTFAKHMQDLAEMVQRMVLQSFGLEKYYDHHIEPKSSALRLSEYGVPLDQETKVALRAHKDPNMLTIICQHQAEGLEVQTKDGEWIHVVPCPNSFTVMIGESFTEVPSQMLTVKNESLSVMMNLRMIQYTGLNCCSKSGCKSLEVRDELGQAHGICALLTKMASMMLADIPPICQSRWFRE